MQTAYIVAAKRTPIGSFLGKLSNIKATELSAIATRAALESKKIDPKHVDEVILGNVIGAGLGQNPARQASLAAGISVSVPSYSIQKVCASGMKSVILGAQQIQLGLSNCIVSGGFESMSNAPFYLQNYRKGASYGNQTLVDGLANDGLVDAYNKIAMGLCAEKTASDFQLTRELQDHYCITSYERTLAAMNSGKFADEIVPVKINDKETVTQDEDPLKFKKEKIPVLKPAFSKTGTITAANASKINDGACSIILMSEQKVKELGLTPLGRIVSYADAEVDPIDFCIAPAKSSQKALDRAGMKISQLEYFEFNEAFSATALANMKLLDIDISKINLHGGAVALGHPVGFSGARIIQSLLTVLKVNKGKYGLAGICNGGGGGSSIIIENLQ
ncbi:hypothetical protein ABPG74_018371 [Tetrahymena malaccensis]